MAEVQLSGPIQQHQVINSNSKQIVQVDSSKQVKEQHLHQPTNNSQVVKGQLINNSDNLQTHQEYLVRMNNGGINQVQRERSFVRTGGQNMQNANKRRSLTLQQQQQQQQQQHGQQIRGKPALEIYRPPSNNHIRIDGNPQNKLNVHAQEFTMSRNDLQTSKSVHSFHQHHQQLQHSKSGANMHHQNMNMHLPLSRVQHPRPILAYNQMQVSPIQGHIPLVASPSSGNVFQQHRVKFAPEPVHHHQQKQQQQQQQVPYALPTPLQRSKSLTSADNLITRSMAGLSLGSEAGDVGNFSPEIQAIIDKALADPNQLPARMLMELATQIMERAVEGRRYSLPISRLCIQIIAKEKKETFLEAVLNTCRQWYNERDKVLGVPPNSKGPVRPRFTAFMSFLTEMFCQLKRRQLQLRTQCDGAPPPIVLLTLLEKCCEECVKPPVRSLSEIECLFFVLTCIGRDLEMQLPQQLEALMTKVRDAFLTSNASAPAIRRTLLQLIELQASHWQLPGNTVLYYYPTQRQAMGGNN